MEVTYRSNNSGGGWWLRDEDWYALEAKGWRVYWVKNRAGRILGPDKDGRWLGALATEASKDFPDLRSAIAEWEHITGKSSNALGCGCCGPPHSFSSDAGEYYSPDSPAYGERY